MATRLERRPAGRLRRWALGATVLAAAAGLVACDPLGGTYVKAPTGVHASLGPIRMAPGTVVLTWNKAATNATTVGEYEIFSIDPALLSGWSTHNGVTSLVITNLAPGSYTFHVRAVILARSGSGILRSEFSLPSNTVHVGS